MTLRTKATLIIAASFLGLIAVLHTVATMMVMDRFRRLETEEATRNANRARDTLDDQLAALAATTGDWAHWDDTAAFITGRAPLFPGINLTDDTFRTLRLDLAALVDATGRIVYLRVFDRRAGRTLSPPPGLDAALGPGKKLVTHAAVDSHREGILVLPDRFFLVASQPVTDNTYGSPALGILVFGRLIEATEIARLSSIVQHDLRIGMLADAGISAAEMRGIVASSAPVSVPLIEVRGENRIDSVLPLRDIEGTLAAALTVSNTRGIYREGFMATRYLTVFLMIVCVAGAALLYVLLSRLVLSPLSGLAAGVRGIGARGGEARLPAGRRDELGEVSDSINGMLDALSRSETQRAQLEESLVHAHRLEAVGTLAGGVAHDFNNILMAILGFCDLIDDARADGADSGDEVAEIRKAATRAASLTDQLLAFSRRQRLELKAIDLNSLLNDTTVMLRALLGSHIALELDLFDGDTTVRGDIGQLQQVIINLSVNARDAMPGGGNLRIETHHRTIRPADAERLGVSPGPHVVCVVTDTGEGMSDAVRARIFEPFFTTKELGRGTGLGLSVVWGIIKQSGGTITVTSSPGCGSRFEIYLPCAQARDEAETPEVSAFPAVRGRGTILVAEDDRAIRVFLAKALTRAGYRVLEASNGEEALLRAAECGGTDIRLLLTDVVMPRMGGAALASRMHEAWPYMKIQFMSGNPGLMETEEPIPAEVSILQKPFNREQLLQSIQSALGD